MFWENNNAGAPSLDVSVGADTDEVTFLYLNVQTEDGAYLVDVLLSDLDDVDKFENQVIAACARFRTMFEAASDDTPAATSKKTPV